MAMQTNLFVDHEDIVLTKEGVFLSNGETITHERMTQAFHRFLGRDEEGYFIEIGNDFKRIEVEDTAYFVRGIDWKENEVILRLSDSTEEALDPETLTLRGTRLACRVKSGKEEAKFLRPAFLEFLLHALEAEGEYSVRIGKKTYPLRDANQP